MKEWRLIVPHACGEIAQFRRYIKGPVLGGDAVGCEFCFWLYNIDRICLRLESDPCFRQENRDGEWLAWRL